jgi:ABC-type sugar transport system substrate-binding protein
MVTLLKRLIVVYWRVGIGAIGALLFAMAAPDAIKGRGLYFIIGGFVTTAASLVLQASFASTNGELSYQLNKLRQENEALRDRRIFVLLAAFKEEFQMELNYYLLKIGRESGLFLQVYCPRQEFDDADYRVGLADIKANVSQYCGGIVVASKFADDKFDELEQFASQIHLPVIFVDHIPPYGGGESSPGQPSGNVRWVTVNDTSGGEKAAEAVNDLGTKPERILVIAGPAKADRQNSFKAAVVRRWPDCSIVITTDGQFNRERARSITRMLVKKSLENNKHYDIIFCTSDSMTLGSLDAIKSFDWDQIRAPCVIGYDGVEATRKLIDEDDFLLQRVVVQDPAILAAAAIHSLQQLKAGAVGPGVVAIEPTLYPQTI